MFECERRKPLAFQKLLGHWAEYVIAHHFLSHIPDMWLGGVINRLYTNYQQRPIYATNASANNLYVHILPIHSFVLSRLAAVTGSQRNAIRWAPDSIGTNHCQ